MIGTCKTFLNDSLSNETILLNELIEMLKNDSLTVIDIFEIIHEAIDTNEIKPSESVEIIEYLINDGLISEDDLIDFWT